MKRRPYSPFQELLPDHGDHSRIICTQHRGRNQYIETGKPAFLVKTLPKTAVSGDPSADDNA
jgi:hypothetical protein